ncbi:NRDE family protein [Glaciimonas immobilis]|nr:NRDE family protein [Glaciimonas immobilis]
MIVAVNLSARWPIMVATIRDEALNRTWVSAGRHWPTRYPEVIGGMDIMTAGSWLALNERKHTLAFIVNREETPSVTTKKSRGELVLQELSSDNKQWSEEMVRDYPGFILGKASANGLIIHEWNTKRLIKYQLGKGIHGISVRGVGVTHPRLDKHLPLFRHSPLPELNSKSTSQRAWGSWIKLFSNDNNFSSDHSALIWRRDIGGVLWASQSAACIGLGHNESRFDVCNSLSRLEVWDHIPNPFNNIEREN